MSNKSIKNPIFVTLWLALTVRVTSALLAQANLPDSPTKPEPLSGLQWGNKNAVQELDSRHKLANIPKGCFVWRKRLNCRQPAERPAHQLSEEFFVHSIFLHQQKLTKALKQHKARQDHTPYWLSLAMRRPYLILNQRKKASDHPIAAAYLTTRSLSRAGLPDKITALQNSGVNGIVFDIKNVRGERTFPWHDPHLKRIYRNERRFHANLSNVVYYLDQRNLHAIARVAIFQDRYLARKYPSWAIQTRSGRPSRRWINPVHPQVQRHHIRIVRELARSGVHEIQLDYVRFPSSGEVAAPVYPRMQRTKGQTRAQVITDFIRQIKKAISPYPVLLSADIFGITAWSSKRDKKTIGQDLKAIAQYLDIISPMLYPSHFNYGFANIAEPANRPRYFLFHGVRKIRQLTHNRAIVRPWIQAFDYRVRRFDYAYIHKQIDSAIKAGAIGYLLWHAAGDYSLITRPGHSLPRKKKDIANR